MGRRPGKKMGLSWRLDKTVSPNQHSSIEFAAMRKMTLSCIFRRELIFICIFYVEYLAKCLNSS
jgi:hypothetical protein